MSRKGALWASEFLVTVHTQVPSEVTEMHYHLSAQALTDTIDRVMRDTYADWLRPEQESLSVEFDVHDSDGTLCADVWLRTVGSKKASISKPKLREAFESTLRSHVDCADVRLEKKLVSQLRCDEQEADAADAAEEDMRDEDAAAGADH